MAYSAAEASVITDVCPKGTKMWLLNLGILNVDDGWYVLLHPNVVPSLISAPRIGFYRVPIAHLEAILIRRTSVAT